jgi:hypothetical protein
VRVLEIGANDAEFARELLRELRVLGEAQGSLDRIDYVAVDLARASLERAAAREEELWVGRTVLRPSDTSGQMVALVVVEGTVAANLGLVHAEATQFARENIREFDVAILNELLDDMPCRAYFAHTDGERFEAAPLSRDEGDGRWTVKVEARPLADGDGPRLEPGTVTARSAECVELVTAIAGALAPGGMLLLHDYGFADPAVPLETYDRPPPSLPAFARLDVPEGPFPRSFFRVFGNEERRVVQVTNDVNFAELVAALEPTGSVAVLPHGSQIPNAGRALEPGQGTFLSEFHALDLDGDVDALLARLARDDGELRERYARAYVGGRPSLFLDLVYLKH